MPTVAEVVGRTLVGLGVRQVFGLIGSGNFDLSNALVDAGARFVTARHETGATTMADAYARVSGVVGVVTLHPGCGLTNAVTGVTEAAKSRTPLLVLAGDTAAAAVRSNFRIDQDGLARAVGAVAERVHGPGSAAEDIIRAHRFALMERRTVVVSLPMDVQAATVAEESLIAPLPPLPRPRPNDALVSRVADLVMAAERPVLLAGRGARGRREILERLGERTGAVLATTAVANGLFAGSPWSIGISGGFASPVAARLIREADVVLGLGAALNMWSTRHGRLLGRVSSLIQVDLEPAAIGAHHPVDVGVVADVGETAAALVAEIERRGGSGGSRRTPELRAEIEAGAWAKVPYEDAGTADAIDPRTLSIALDRILPRERTLAVDSGHFMGWPSQYLSVPDEAGFVFTQAFQCVGLGLATAIGAAVARPDRLTVAALGDGGALMGLADLETVARLRLRMVVVVYNDCAYGAEVHHFGPHGKPLELVRFPDTDFAALGRAVGLQGITVRTREDLKALADWVRHGTEGGVVVDAKVVPSVVADWLEEAFRGH
jgi:thiamine pyrophosphate-dependent acetolactate synthase large subunit-like protein